MAANGKFSIGIGGLVGISLARTFEGERFGDIRQRKRSPVALPKVRLREAHCRRQSRTNQLPPSLESGQISTSAICSMLKLARIAERDGDFLRLVTGTFVCAACPVRTDTNQSLVSTCCRSSQLISCLLPG